MTDTTLNEICLIVGTRNLLAKRRQMYRNKRRNYKKRPARYAALNEQALNKVNQELHVLSAATTLKLRRRLNRVYGSLGSDGQAGYRLILLDSVEQGQRCRMSYIKKSAIGILADKFATDILSENSLLGIKHKWLKLAKYYGSLKAR